MSGYSSDATDSPPVFENLPLETTVLGSSCLILPQLSRVWLTTVVYYRDRNPLPPAQKFGMGIKMLSQLNDGGKWGRVTSIAIPSHV